MNLPYKNNFFQRLTLGTLLSFFLFAAIYLLKEPFFQPLFALFVALAISSAVWEYYQISKANGYEPITFIGIIGSFTYVFSIYGSNGTPYSFEISLMVLFLILFSSFLFYFFSGRNPLVNLAITAFGISYLTVPLSSFLSIGFSFGRIWLVYLLLVTKFTDIGAYLIGKKWGNRALAPVISPNKTWEGALGGFLFGLLASSLLQVYSVSAYGEGLFNSFLENLFVGSLLSITAQASDLFESLLKRDSGVKDSNSLPGLGGMLDMVDSLVFTTPLLYFFLKLSSISI